MNIKNFLYFFILYLFFSNIIFSEKYFNVSNVLEKYYNYFVYLEGKNPEFRIKEEIKEFKENDFVLYSKDIRNMEILKREKFDLSDKSWKIEKLYFPKIYGMFDVFSPEPKIPRDYYKLKEDFDEKSFNKLLKIKVNPFSINIPNAQTSAYPLYYDNLIPSKINFDIEYFLFIDDNLKQALENNFESIIISIKFLQDTSPFNIYDRKIRIYGVIEEIKWIVKI